MNKWLIGIDLVDINRFRAFTPSKHHRFYSRVFNKYEFQYCINFSDPFPHFAGIFAAKEAIFKAVNKLIPLSIPQISIFHDKRGKPVVWSDNSETHTELDNEWLHNQNLEVQVSITHSSSLALAWALVFSKSSTYDLFIKSKELNAEFQQVIDDELFKFRCTS